MNSENWRSIGRNRKVTSKLPVEEPRLVIGDKDFFHRAYLSKMGRQLSLLENCHQRLKNKAVALTNKVLSNVICAHDLFFLSSFLVLPSVSVNDILLMYE